MRRASGGGGTRGIAGNAKVQYAPPTNKSNRDARILNFKAASDQIWQSVLSERTRDLLVQHAKG